MYWPSPKSQFIDGSAWRDEILPAFVFCLAFFPILGILPWLFPANPGVSSVSSALGYNNRIAYILVFVWSLLGLFLFGIFQRKHLPADPAVAPAPWKFHFVETGIVLALVLILYCPFFLAKYGPYIEDNAFLTMLHRMQSGQRPYVDFEFLYGPLMIFPAHLWMTLSGYSMHSYYGFLALLEAGQFSLLLMFLRRYLPDPRERVSMFLLLAIFFFNAVLGPNYNGFRKLLPVIFIFSAAENPNSKRTLIALSVGLGLLFAYSHELAVACLIAIVSMVGLKGIKDRDVGAFKNVLLISSLSIVVWLACTVLILGGAGFQAYIDASRVLLSRFAMGEQAFPFRWTVNYATMFGLLSFACCFVGKGWRRKEPVSSGDLILFGGLVYALVALRGGLNRSDIWHLTPAFLVLVFCFVLPLPRSLFSFSRQALSLIRVFILLMAATYAFSLAPFGSFYAKGLALGMRDTLLGTAQKAEMHSRSVAIETERSHPDPDVVALAGFLSAPETIGRPVVFYGRTWPLDKRVGADSTVYVPDDFLMSDEEGSAIKDFLDRKPDALVILDRPVYNHLFGPSDAQEYASYLDRMPMTRAKSICVWLSTAFFADASVEWRLKEERWERTVGFYVRAHFRKAQEFGNLIVVER